MVVRSVIVTLCHCRRLKFNQTLVSRTLTGKMALATLEHLQTEKFTLRLEPVLDLAAKAYAVTLHVDKLHQQFPALSLEQMRS